SNPLTRQVLSLTPEMKTNNRNMIAWTLGGAAILSTFFFCVGYINLMLIRDKSVANQSKATGEPMFVLHLRLGFWTMAIYVLVGFILGGAIGYWIAWKRRAK